MSEWQPIETAPKDGTPILGGWVCEYPDGSKYMDGVIIMYEGGEGRVMQGAWAYMGIMVSLVREDDPPTHWLQIPAPPAVEGEP